MSRPFSSKQVLISLGAMFLISSVSNAYNADDHVEVIKRRCSTLKSSDEVIGCFNNDITVLEQIRRRERQEARDKHRQQKQQAQRQQQQVQRPSKPAKQQPAPVKQRPKPVETDVADRPIPQKPAPQQQVQPAAPNPPVAQRPPAPVPAPAPAPANPNEQPAMIRGDGSAPVIADNKPAGDNGRFTDAFKETKESDNISYQIDGKEVTWDEFKKHREQQAAKPAEPAQGPIAGKPQTLDGAKADSPKADAPKTDSTKADGSKKQDDKKIPDGIIVDDSGKYSSLNPDENFGQERPMIADSARALDGSKANKTPAGKLEEKHNDKTTESKSQDQSNASKKDENRFKDMFKDKRESKNVVDSTKQQPESDKKGLQAPAGIAIEDSGKYSSLKPDDRLGQDRPHIVDSARIQEGTIEVQKGKKAGDQASAEKATPASGEGKVCHSGGDQSDYHCHDGVTELEKPKRDTKAEEAAAKAAEASSGGDTCSQWKSPMRGNHRMTDCIGASRPRGRKHAGIDLGNGQQPNTPIYSVGKGKVIQAGWMGGYGCVVQIQHDECPGPIQAYPNFNSDKCVSFYAHLQPAGGKKCPMVGKAGTQVNSCTKIGIMGGSGGNYAKHLHFEMRLKKQSGVRINPMVALGKEIRGAATNGSSNMCKGTESWLAATGQGVRTHSVKSQGSGQQSRQAAARQ